MLMCYALPTPHNFVIQPKIVADYALPHLNNYFYIKFCYICFNKHK